MTQSPILFIIFNRPDITARVFAEIKAAKPARLYIAADGPRPAHPTDAGLCSEARAITAQIDWDCELYTLFREENKGCKIAVSEAITWFFTQEEEGIILEDDCLPHPWFFTFCDAMLERYRLDTRVRNITGTNLQMGRQWGSASYYFSRYSNIWGWASWRRVWQEYDAELSRYSEADAQRLLPKVFSDPFLVEGWMWIFRELKAGRIDTWDYQLNFITFFGNGLCVTPNINLISNIGFRADATHTFNPANHHANLPYGVPGPLSHPVSMLPEEEADYFFLAKEFELEKKWRKHNKLTRRLKRWAKSLFKV